MRFSFDRSQVVMRIFESPDKKRYIFWGMQDGRIEVLKRMLAIRVNKSIGKNTGKVLLDVKPAEGPARDEAVLSAENEWKIKQFFRVCDLSYPGLTRRRSRPNR